MAATRTRWLQPSIWPAFKYHPQQVASWAAKASSLAVRAVEEDKQLDEQTRRESANRYAKEAIAMITLAVERGYDNVQELRTNREFDPIRNREEFKQLLDQLPSDGK